tara:strand:- start:2338 stop:2493 length:156 start_codon:yes stop_codon:yes gene_type:complete
MKEFNPQSLKFRPIRFTSGPYEVIETKQLMGAPLNESSGESAANEPTYSGY